MLYISGREEMGKVAIFRVAEGSAELFHSSARGGGKSRHGGDKSLVHGHTQRRGGSLFSHDSDTQDASILL